MQFRRQEQRTVSDDFCDVALAEAVCPREIERGGQR